VAGAPARRQLVVLQGRPAGRAEGRHDGAATADGPHHGRDGPHLLALGVALGRQALRVLQVLGLAHAAGDDGRVVRVRGAVGVRRAVWVAVRVAMPVERPAHVVAGRVRPQVQRLLGPRHVVHEAVLRGGRAHDGGLGGRLRLGAQLLLDVGVVHLEPVMCRGRPARRGVRGRPRTLRRSGLVIEEGRVAHEDAGGRAVAAVHVGHHHGLQDMMGVVRVGVVVRMVDAVGVLARRREQMVGAAVRRGALALEVLDDGARHGGQAVLGLHGRLGRVGRVPGAGRLALDGHVRRAIEMLEDEVLHVGVREVTVFGVHGRGDFLHGRVGRDASRVDVHHRGIPGCCTAPRHNIH